MEHLTKYHKLKEDTFHIFEYILQKIEKKSLNKNFLVSLDDV